MPYGIIVLADGTKFKTHIADKNRDSSLLFTSFGTFEAIDGEFRWIVDNRVTLEPDMDIAE